jgi:hypothetical protein
VVQYFGNFWRGNWLLCDEALFSNHPMNLWCFIFLQWQIHTLHTVEKCGIQSKCKLMLTRSSATLYVQLPPTLSLISPTPPYFHKHHSIANNLLLLFQNFSSPWMTSVCTELLVGVVLVKCMGAEKLTQGKCM